jgi:hypothetical protein
MEQIAKRRESKNRHDTQPVSDAHPVGESLPESDTRTGDEDGFDLQGDMGCVPEAMNTYWTVDDAATDVAQRHRKWSRLTCVSA